MMAGGTALAFVDGAPAWKRQRGAYAATWVGFGAAEIILGGYRLLHESPIEKSLGVYERMNGHRPGIDRAANRVQLGVAPVPGGAVLGCRGSF